MRREEGLTLIELLVAISLLAVVSLGFYSVMLAGTRSSRDTRDVSRISEEARLGLNRIIRDAREAHAFRTIDGDGPSSTAFRIWVDFDGNGTFLAHPGTTSGGDYEDLTYVYDAANQTISVGGPEPHQREVLIDGVTPIPGRDMFSYTSNRLEHDSNEDGTVTPAELSAAQAGGALLVSPIYNNFTEIRFAFNITQGRRTTPFTSEVQMRNRRHAGTDQEAAGGS